MNFLVDVHLPIRLSKFLDEQPECNSIHVNQILQRWFTDDSEICKYADQNDFVVVTKDRDFKDSDFVNNTPKKVIRIGLGNISNNELIILIDKYMPLIFPALSRDFVYIEIYKDQITIIE